MDPSLNRRSESRFDINAPCLLRVASITSLSGKFRKSQYQVLVKVHGYSASWTTVELWTENHAADRQGVQRLSWLSLTSAVSTIQSNRLSSRLNQAPFSPMTRLGRFTKLFTRTTCWISDWNHQPLGRSSTPRLQLPVILAAGAAGGKCKF